MPRAIGVIVVIVLAATALGMMGARSLPAAARAIPFPTFDPNNIVAIRLSPCRLLLHPFLKRLAFIDNVDGQELEGLVPHDFVAGMRNFTGVDPR
jgi:hypothetical protein